LQQQRSFVTLTMILHFVARGAGHREGKIGWHEEQITSVGCRGKKNIRFFLEMYFIRRISYSSQYLWRNALWAESAKLHTGL